MAAEIFPQRAEVMVVVGEASGDIHAAAFVDALLRRDPSLHVFGVAGERLQETRFETLFTVARLTGMGLVELAGNLQNIWSAYRLLCAALRERRPRLLVLVDFPEFNLRLARLARRLRVPVLYYVSPQIWAWRRRRVRQIARWVDRMAVVFPFEVRFYQKHGVDVTFVGHPLLDNVKVTESRESVLARLGIHPQSRTIALLPGSRRSEVQYHLAIMARAAAHLQRERGIRFFCVRASTVSREELAEQLRGAGIDVPLVEENRYDAVNAADLVWAASGTATLETALLLKPMVVVYRLSPLTYRLARLLVKVNHIAMVNLIAEKPIVPELIQSDFTAERLIEETLALFDDRKLYRKTVAELAQLKEKLGSPGAAERVADLALAMIRQDGAAAHAV